MMGFERQCILRYVEIPFLFVFETRLLNDFCGCRESLGRDRDI